MTVLDELVVRLSLDPTQFNQGTKQGQDLLRKFRQEVKTTADSTEREASKMTDGFSRVTKELLGLGLAVMGVNGLKNLVVGTVAAADAQGRLASSIGLSTEKLSAYVNLAQRAGVTAGAADAGVRSLRLAAQAVAERKMTPEQAGLSQMRKIGVYNPDWYNFEHLYEQLVTAFQKDNPIFRTAPAARATAAESIPGGEMLLQVANQFRPGELAKELARSITLTEQQAEAARGVTKALTELKLAIDTRLNALIPGAAPTALKALEGGKALVEGDLPKAREMDRQVGHAVDNWLWDTFVKVVLPEGKQGKWLSGSGVNAVGPFQEYGPPMPFDMTNSGRSLSAGDSKIRDRLPGLSGRTQWDNTNYRGWAAGGSAGPIDNSRTIQSVTINVTTPPGADPRTTGGLIASYFISAVEAQTGGR